MTRGTYDGDWIADRCHGPHVERNLHSIAHDRRIGRVHKARVDFAARDIIENLPRIQCEDTSRFDRIPELCTLERRLGVAPRRNSAWTSHRDPTKSRRRKFVKL